MQPPYPGPPQHPHGHPWHGGPGHGAPFGAPGYGHGPPPKKGMSGCAIAAIVVGLAGVLGLGTCVALVAIGASTEAERPARAKTARPVVPSAYEGAWSGGGITLVLSGRHADYKKKDGGTSVSVNGKYTLDGPDIEIDLFVTSKTIEVDDPPHEEAGVWKMTVEGVELTRSP